MKITVTGDEMAAWTPERRAEIIAWAEANGLVPNKVVAETGLTVEDGQIHYHEFELTSEGRVQLDRDGDAVKSIPRTAPLLVPWPADEIVKSQREGAA